MITLRDRTNAEGTIHAELVLPYELREKSRLKAKLSSGEDVALFLPRGTVLRGGDCLRADDGKRIRVVAAPERVYSVECHEPAEFARVAFHLGNRHTPVQILGDVDGHLVLRIRADTVLKDMLEGLGAHVFEEEAPFEPEAGAYGGGHSHAHDGHAHDGHAHGGHGHSHDAPVHDHDPANPANRMPRHAPKIHRHGEPPIVKDR